jgi:hypothetical protein
VTMYPNLPERLVRDEAEMREFFQRMGLSPEVIERAVRARFNTPPEEQYVDHRGLGHRKRPGRPANKNPAPRRGVK